MQTPDHVASSPPDGDVGDGNLPLGGIVQRQAGVVAVERAGQAAVRGDQDDQPLLDLAHGEKRMLVLRGATHQLGHDAGDLVAVRARGEHALLRTAHARRGDELHRLGDLAHVLDALDTAAQIAQARHGASASGAAPQGADELAHGHPANVFLNSSTAERSDASVSSEMRPLVAITSSMSGCV